MELGKMFVTLGVKGQANLTAGLRQAKAETVKAADGSVWNKFSGGIEAAKTKLNGLRTGLTQAGHLAARFVAGATAGILGFAKANSDAVGNNSFTVFTASLQYMSAQIGALVLPLVMELTGHIINFANWIRGLSKEQKENAAQWIKWAVIAGALLMILPKVVLVMSTLLTVFQGFATVIGVMFSVAGAVVALAAAAAYAAVQYAKLNMERKAGERIDQLKQEQGMSSEEIKKTQEFQQVSAAGGKEEQKAKAKEMIAEYQAEVDKIKAENNSKSNFGRGIDVLTGSQDSLEEKLKETGLKLNRYENILKELGGEDVRGGRAKEAEAEAASKKSGKGSVPLGLSGLQTKSELISIGDSWRKASTAQAEDPAIKAQRMLYERQGEGNDILKEILDAVKKTDTPQAGFVY